MSAPRRETLHLRTFWPQNRQATVEVEYVEVEHMFAKNGGTNAAGRPWKAYVVLVDGEKVGTVQQATES